MNDTDRSNFTPLAKDVVTAAIAAAAARGDSRVTPIHFLYAALNGEDLASRALRSSIGDPDRLASVLSEALGVRAREPRSPTLDASSRAILDAASTDQSEGVAGILSQTPVDRLQLISAVLDAPEVASLLLGMGMDSPKLQDKVLTEFRRLMASAPSPIIIEEHRGEIVGDHAWAIEYVVERLDKSRLIVRAHCSERAASAIDQDNDTMAAKAYSERCRSLAIAIGYQPGIRQVQLWFNDVDGTLRTDLEKLEA
jgi:hypothetical protein